MTLDWYSAGLGFMAGWFWSLLVIGVCSRLKRDNKE